MIQKKIDVIIPAYRPGAEFEALLNRLEGQSYPVSRIIVMNTCLLYTSDAADE